MAENLRNAIEHCTAIMAMATIRMGVQLKRTLAQTVQFVTQAGRGVTSALSAIEFHIQDQHLLLEVCRINDCLDS